MRPALAFIEGQAGVAWHGSGGRRRQDCEGDGDVRVPVRERGGSEGVSRPGLGRFGREKERGREERKASAQN